MAQQTIDIGSAPNDGTGDPIRDAFDKCNDNFTELYGSLAGLLDFQGATDCSANPNYPAASQGDIYIVSVAGKIGGASGKVVEVGDFYLALADNAGGAEASVGTSWAVLQANITGGIGSGVDVEDEGTPEATGATTLNFVGAGVTAADVGGGVVDITIPGSSGGIDIEDEGVAEATAATVLNFTGAGVTATDVGGGTVDIDIPGGSGSVTVIESQTLSAVSTFSLEALAGGSYKRIEIEIEGSFSTDGSHLVGTLKLNGGYKTANYRRVMGTRTSSNAGQNNDSAATTGILMTDTGATWGVGNAAGEGMSSIMTILNPYSTASRFKKGYIASEWTSPAGSLLGHQLNKFQYEGTDYETALQGVKFDTNAGTFTGIATVRGYT